MLSYHFGVDALWLQFSILTIQSCDRRLFPFFPHQLIEWCRTPSRSHYPGVIVLRLSAGYDNYCRTVLKFPCIVCFQFAQNFADIINFPCPVSTIMSDFYFISLLCYVRFCSRHCIPSVWRFSRQNEIRFYAIICGYLAYLSLLPDSSF